jgi:protein-disulfide isomerase
MLFDIDKQKGLFNIRGMAKIAGFDVIEFAGAINDKALQRKLRADISGGNKLGITGTPGYVINGKVYIGQVPPEIINVLKD